MIHTYGIDGYSCKNYLIPSQKGDVIKLLGNDEVADWWYGSRLVRDILG